MVEASTFDRVSRWLGHRNDRREAVLKGTGLVGAVLAGITTRSRRVRAAPPPLPPLYEDWPPCSDDRADYCVAEYTIGGIDRLAAPTPDLRLWVLGTKSQPDDTEVNRVEWSVNGERTQSLDESTLDQDVVVRLRTGRLRPTFGAAWGVGLFASLSGSTEDGWMMTFTGRPGLRQSPSRDDPEVADEARVVCSGMYHDLTESNPGYPDGLYVSTIQNAGFPEWRDGAWLVSLHAPHLAADGSVNRGSYSAWISPDNLARMGLTIEQAVAGGLAVTVTDDGVVAPVPPFSVTEREGGASIAIIDLTFSSPILKMAKKGGGRCAKKCLRGQVCRKGRCVRR